MPETYGDYIAVLTAGLRKMTDVEAPEAPAAPTITAVSDGNGASATITVDGDAGVTNRLYYRRTSVAAWTTGATRSGDGAIQQTGLTAGPYEFVVISDNAGAYSLVSNPVVLRVSATGAVAPTGLLSLPLYYLRKTVAASPTFQEWIGQSGPHVALPYVQPLEAVPARFSVAITDGAISAITVLDGGNGYYEPPAIAISGDGTGATATATVVNGTVTAVTVGGGGGTGYTNAKAVASLPARLAVAGLSREWGLVESGRGTRTHFSQTGDLLLTLQEAVVAGTSTEDALNGFANTVGAILADLQQLAGTPGYLDFTRASYDQPPARPRLEEVASLGDFHRAVIRFSFEGL